MFFKKKKNKLETDKTPEIVNLNKYSPYRDLIFYSSSMNPEIKLAMIVNKPRNPSYIVATTHNFHDSIPEFEENENKPSNYLYINIDMRGRAQSEGKPDLNGFELYDVYDAIEYVKEHYKEYILDPEVIYFEGKEGAAGNGLALMAKFPDYFSAIICKSPISDYGRLYKSDKENIFKPAMDEWVGEFNDLNIAPYVARSGFFAVSNLFTHILLIHGEKDKTISPLQSTLFVEEAKKHKKSKNIQYIELEKASDFESLSQADKDKVNKASESFKFRHNKPIVLPNEGELLVEGFLRTKTFEIILSNINSLAKIQYNIDKKRYNVICSRKTSYKIKFFDKNEENIN